MKKIAAFFSGIMTLLTSVCLTIGASAAGASDKPFMDGFMKKYGHIILLACLGIFLVVAIIVLIRSFRSSRKKHQKMLEYKNAVHDLRNGKYVEKTSDTTVERVIENGETVERVVEKSDACAAQPGNYYYYDYRYYNNHAYPVEFPYCGPACRELEYEARRVPERHLNEIPPVRRAVKPIKPIPPKPVKATTPVLPVRPVEVKDVEAKKAEDGVVTVQDSACKVNKKHIAAAVALTAVGCHLLYKASK